ncbi:MAG: nuclear transport factor 2 family protein [Nocardioidaceae bacterium]
MAEPAVGGTGGVEAANRSFYTAIESGDIDLMTALWLPGEDTACVHPGNEVVRGTPAILRSWSLVMASTPYIQFFLTDVAMSAHGDVALVGCTENILAAGEGAPAAELTGGRAVALNTFVRTGAGWRMWAHHASPVLGRGNEPAGPGEET